MEDGRSRLKDGSPISDLRSAREAMISIEWNPDRKQLRQFAGIWFPAFCALVGWSIARKTGLWYPVKIVWMAGGALALAGLIYPPLIRPVFIGLILITFPIGWVVSHVILGVIYFGVVMPVGLIVRMVGHDPLQLRPPEGDSLWKTPVGKTGSAGYLRQS